MARSSDQGPTAPPGKPHPLSCAEFARRVGKAKSRVSEATRGALAAAMLPTGRIDAAHPAAVAWAAERGCSASVLLGARTATVPPPPDDEAAPAAPKASPHRPAAPPARVAAPPPAPARAPAQVRFAPGEDVDPTDERLQELTLREIVDRFGSVQGFDDHVDVIKTLAEIDRIELANAKARGELVKREDVQRTFSALDGALRRMVVDVPKTIARRLKQDVAAGASTEEVEKQARALISAALDGVKLATTEKLPDENGTDDDDGDP